MIPRRPPLARILRSPAIVASLAGAAAACGFQPLALWPLTLVGIAALIALVRHARGWASAAFFGWCWGVGHFTVGNGWIATAFTYQAKMPAGLGSIAVVGLSLYLALFPAVAAGGAWWFRRRLSALVPGFAGCWIVSEWLRSWVCTGFAWNPLGVALLGGFNRPGLAMLLPWCGTYALSGLSVVFAGCLVGILRAPRPPQRITCAALSGALALGMAAGPTAPRANGHIPYTLVQPNVAQTDLDDPAHFEAQFVDTARLSVARGPGAAGRLVLWPESGEPDYLRSGYPAFYYRDTFAGDPAAARRRIARVIGPDSLLLTGSTDLDFADQRLVDARNVITAIDGHGLLLGSYAKAHLVPYGEYLPMRWLLSPLGLARLVPGEIDFAAGPGPQTLDLRPFGRAGLQLCYEIVFSGQVVDLAPDFAQRPDYIVNPSVDGWFGAWGPPQHLAQARLRAIEEGLPVLRATTNGISAVVDANGIVRGSIPRGVAGRIDGMIPPPLPPTLFAHWHNMLPLGWAMLALALAGLRLIANRRRPR